MQKYVIGLDFGTLSGRAAVVSLTDGSELAHSVVEYAHGVMDTALPSGRPLPPDWALQHPADYLEVLKSAIPEAIRASRIDPRDIVGIGVDFTACTMLPVLSDGTPLCMLPEYRDEPHAYVKLWKHHGAQEEANRMSEIARGRGESWLRRYGGQISSEGMFPKVWQLLREAPEIYRRADLLLEAGDWIIWQLTGNLTRNACAAGYKSIWQKEDGYPGRDFFRAVDLRLENLIQDKMQGPVIPLGTRAGEITPEASRLTGLLPGTAVAAANVDAHAAVPAVCIDRPGKLLAIIGTSTCHMVLDREEHDVPGICGYVEDGMMPGYFGYEAGQSCVGDQFAWFVDNCVPASMAREAAENGENIHQYLTRLASREKPGQSGLLALDWWNGNRSILTDIDLSGVMLGMTLQIRPEEMYRALIESTAFGTRTIVDNFTSHGIAVHEIYAAGGISQKNPMMMQIYADVLNLPVYIADTTQCGALGSAMMAAVAAGPDRGGYDSIYTAASRMSRIREEYYRPNPEHTAIYDRLYREYQLLHDYFGRGANDVMKRLKQIKAEQFGK